MAVDVTKCVYWSLFRYSGGQFSHSVHRGMYKRRWTLPLAVHVVACEISPVIPLDHAVCVQHRNDIENILFSKLLGMLLWWEQIFDNPFDGVGSLYFSRVYSRSNYHSFLLLVSLQVLQVLRLSPHQIIRNVLCMRCTFHVILIRQPVPNELSLVKVCVRVIFHRLIIGKGLFDAICYSNHLDFVLAETFAQGLNL